MKNYFESNAIIKICQEDNLPQELINDYICDWKENEKESPTHKKHKRRSSRNKKNKDYDKIKKLIDCNGYFYCEKENEQGKKYYTRFYLSGPRKFAKKMTNKKIRKSYTYVPKGAFYRKTFDYDNTLF